MCQVRSPLKRVEQRYGLLEDASIEKQAGVETFVKLVTEEVLETSDLAKVGLFGVDEVQRAQYQLTEKTCYVG